MLLPTNNEKNPPDIINLKFFDCKLYVHIPDAKRKGKLKKSRNQLHVRFLDTQPLKMVLNCSIHKQNRRFGVMM